MSNAIDVVISDLLDYCNTTEKIDYGKMCFIHLLSCTKIFNCEVVKCEVERAEDTRFPMFYIIVTTENKKTMTVKYFLTSYQYLDFKELFEKEFKVRVDDSIIRGDTYSKKSY